jgi:diguanylate cyclase (GGDEF)-like protein
MAQGPQELVLILDDDPVLCNLLKEILEDSGFQTISFTDPGEVLEFLNRTRPDAIISDVNMPSMSGWSFRQKLLADERLRLIPFVFLTGRGEMEDKVQGLTVGADAYLTKPFQPVELVATVNNVLSRARQYQSTLEIDPLTKTYNRFYLERNVPSSPFACAMIDIDHFKQINDRYGHQTGDLVLSTVAKIIKKNIRKEDILVRYGGEEFLLFLPGQAPRAAFVVVDRIRQVIASMIFSDVTAKQHFHVTISSGLSEFSPVRSLEEVIREADTRMYYAKAHGRDRTVWV